MREKISNDDSKPFQQSELHDDHLSILELVDEDLIVRDRNVVLSRLRPKDKVKVSSNKYGQLVDEINGCGLMSYVGTLVHNQHNVPL